MGVQQDLTKMSDEELVEAFETDVIREDDGKLPEVGYGELRAELLRRLTQKRLVVVGSDGRLLARELRRVVDLLPAKGRDEYLQDMPKDVREALGRNPG